MAINSRLAHCGELFASQFEPDGADFLYRKSMKGSAIRVSRAERDGFVTTFDRRIRYGMWALVCAILLLIGLLMFLLPDVSRDAHEVPLSVGTVLLLLAFVGVFHWIWGAPARALDRRPVAGVARTRVEVRQLLLAKLTYRQLALAPAAAIYMVWKASTHSDVLHNWGLLWLIFAGLLIVAAAIQAARKWLFEHKGAGDV